MDSFINGFLTGLLGGIGSLFVYHVKFAMKLDERLTAIEAKIQGLCSRLEKVENKLNNFDKELKQHGERIAKLEGSG